MSLPREKGIPRISFSRGEVSKRAPSSESFAESAPAGGFAPRLSLNVKSGARARTVFPFHRLLRGGETAGRLASAVVNAAGSAPRRGANLSSKSEVTRIAGEKSEKNKDLADKPAFSAFSELRPGAIYKINKLKINENI